MVQLSQETDAGSMNILPSKVLVPEPRLMATLASFAISAWYLQIALYWLRTSSLVLGGLLCVCVPVCVYVCMRVYM